MKYTIVTYFIATVFFTAFFYLVSFETKIDAKLFFTASSLFFTIFSGFFISRQSARYSSIRDKVTAFDGGMSFIYRAFGHFNKTAQGEAGEILKRHYAPIMENHAWDYPFTHKTSTLTDFHALLEKTLQDTTPTPVQNAVLAQTMVALRESQLTRKNLIALEDERVPLTQWFLMLFLGVLLFLALLAIPSYSDMLSAFLKGSYAGTIVFILLILWKLDRLEFFEGTIGESSAIDVLNITEGKR